MARPPNDPEFWRRASALYDELAELSPRERDEALAAATPDLRFRDVVRRWLEGSPAARLPEVCPLPPEGLPLPGVLPVGTIVGTWRITGLAGQGGMGLVYQAERADGSFDRRVALKVTTGPATSALIHQRFLAERRILAGLEHPNIAQLLDAGVTAEGQPWFAMEYVAGEPIDQWARARRVDDRAVVRLFRQVTAAVAHAHRRLVIHRDLKPSNILVTQDGSAKLLDFGIARLTTPEADGGEGLARMLTPAYASPEQRRGEESSVASDVYSLGVVLSELLTAGASPGRLGPDLTAVLRTALQPDPAHRYPSVEALESDLTAWLEGMPVRARPNTWSYRANRFVRRHPVGVGASLVVAAVLVGLTLVAQLQATRARREAYRAEQAAGFLTGLLELPYPFDSGGAPASLRALLDAGRTQADSLIALGTPPDPQVLEALGLGYSGLADYELAAAITRQALLVRQTRGDGDSAEIGTRLQLGIAEMLGGKERAARTTVEQALPLAQRRFGPASPRAGQVLVTLLTIERRLGNLERVDTLAARARAILEANPGAARIALAHAHTQLGHVAMERGDWATAETEYRRAFQVREASGASKLESANSQSSVALAVAETGRLEEAARLLAESREVKVRLVDPLDPELTDQLRFEARLALLRGDAARAAGLYREVLERHRARRSAVHWRVTPALVGLGQALVALGQPVAAQAPLRAGLDSLNQVVEGQSRLRVEARRALAGIVRAAGKAASADSLESLAQAEADRLTGPGSPSPPLRGTSSTPP